MNKITNLQQHIVKRREKPISLKELSLTHCFEPKYFMQEKTAQNFVFTKKFLAQDFALYDGNKVTGYLVYGQYYDLRKFY